MKQHGADAIVITFSVRTCRSCPFQEQCTSSALGRRMLTLRPREPHEALVRARAEQKTETWKAKYALRAGVEGTINQPGPGHHRHAPGPLPRTAESPPPARLLRHRSQRDPARRVLDRTRPAPHPQQPPRTPRLPTHGLTPELRSRVTCPCSRVVSAARNRAATRFQDRLTLPQREGRQCLRRSHERAVWARQPGWTKRGSSTDGDLRHSRYRWRAGDHAGNGVCAAVGRAAGVAVRYCA
ncbi:transposase [Streptomyces sasae]|uniref:transposase n=1 Tax=Streptomyces sasae TaxID=1266772 RepID=UPI00292E31F1|nr:transposase [Streptomyces sasae]